MNVYDIRRYQNLYYILDSTEPNTDNKPHKSEKTLILIYLYYEDMLERWSKYILQIPTYMTCIVISSNDAIINSIKNDVRFSNVILQKKENIGRDVSALLVEAREWVLSADYVCFVHDKKEHQSDDRTFETDFWVTNMWENTLASATYIEKVINVFDSDSNIGVLSIPEPIGFHFDTWAGQGWYGSFEATKALAEKLQLNCEISRNKPPITIGTALWFRTASLKKLFLHEWKYSDFNDEKLNDGNYLSYAVERIFPYVAQDAGYVTGTVMTLEYAIQQTSIAQSICSVYANTLSELIGVTSAYECNCLTEGYDRIREECMNARRIFLYGAGHYGKVISKYLMVKGHKIFGFYTTDLPEVDNVNGVEVHHFGEDDIVDDKDLIIITVFSKETQKEIKSVLSSRKLHYISYWG